jgi:hypothetical protein
VPTVISLAEGVSGRMRAGSGSSGSSGSFRRAGYAMMGKERTFV